MIYNPAAWYAVIKCGCADTFQSAYPQCVDCFVQVSIFPESDVPRSLFNLNQYLTTSMNGRSHSLFADEPVRAISRGSQRLGSQLDVSHSSLVLLNSIPRAHCIVLSLDGIRQVCGLGSAILGGVATSQASAGISYTYTAQPSQGYPTTTSYGPGGLDLGSAQGASSGAERLATEFGLLAVLVLAIWAL